MLINPGFDVPNPDLVLLVFQNPVVVVLWSTLLSWISLNKQQKMIMKMLIHVIKA